MGTNALKTRNLVYNSRKSKSNPNPLKYLPDNAAVYKRSSGGRVGYKVAWAKLAQRFYEMNMRMTPDVEIQDDYDEEDDEYTGDPSKMDHYVDRDPEQFPKEPWADWKPYTKAQ